MRRMTKTYSTFIWKIFIGREEIVPALCASMESLLSLKRGWPHYIMGLLFLIKTKDWSTGAVQVMSLTGFWGRSFEAKWWCSPFQKCWLSPTFGQHVVLLNKVMFTVLHMSCIYDIMSLSFLTASRPADWIQFHMTSWFYFLTSGG